MNFKHFIMSTLHSNVLDIYEYANLDRSHANKTPFNGFFVIQGLRLLSFKASYNTSSVLVCINF